MGYRKSMCGIAGVIGSESAGVADALQRMNDAQSHRGPDDVGTSLLPFGNSFIGLGHRRLSIIDLSPLGHQPMIHPHTGDQIIFNGEIYNFQELRRDLENAGEKFKGHSDTEILLHGLTLWGPDFIKRLEGMFALAFYDVRKQTLLLCRDSVGIKPLYIARRNGWTLFASEVRAVLASNRIPKKLDREGLAALFAFGATQHPYTIAEGVRSFPPGHYQIIHADGKAEAPVQYWKYPMPTDQRNELDLIQEIRETMSSAVKDHLVADVPVGVFLSSGLDSTVIASLGVHHIGQLRTFTVGFEDQKDLSESGPAADTAKLLGTEHVDIQITGTDALEGAKQWLSCLDQPSVDGLNVFVISKAVRNCGITVALSGQGGDELFGGYPSFGEVPVLQGMVRKLRMVPGPLRSLAVSVGTIGKSAAVKQKFSDMSRSDGSILELYLHRRRAMSDHQLALLGLHAEELGMTKGFQPREAMSGVDLPEDDAIAAVSILESRLYQGNMLLRDSDTNSMAHSLELRVPILDQRMLNLMHAVPGRMRLPVGKANKHLMRAAFPDLLRSELLEQKKKGFTLPIRRWMLGPLKELCVEGLNHLKSTNVLHNKGIDEIWNTFLIDPESPIWTRAFILSVTGIYLKQMDLG